MLITSYNLDEVFTSNAWILQQNFQSNQLLSSDCYNCQMQFTHLVILPKWFIKLKKYKLSLSLVAIHSRHENSYEIFYFELFWSLLGNKNVFESIYGQTTSPNWPLKIPETLYCKLSGSLTTFGCSLPGCRLYVVPVLKARAAVESIVSWFANVTWTALLWIFWKQRRKWKKKL